MIDAHCHLEQKEFDEDRDRLIEEWKEKLDAIVTCCCHPEDWKLSLNLVERYKGFVFLTAGLHPEYAHEFEEKEIERFISVLQDAKTKLVAIGEVGLDFYWVSEREKRKRQVETFRKFIELAEELHLPLVIHARNAFREVIEELESYNCKRVLMHLFGDPSLLSRVVENGWLISIGPIIKRSEKHRRLVKECPLENILTETDSPWFGEGERGTPLNVSIVIEKIAEIKGLSPEEVDEITTKNAVNFYGLRLTKE